MNEEELKACMRELLQHSPDEMSAVRALIDMLGEVGNPQSLHDVRCRLQLVLHCIKNVEQPSTSFRPSCFLAPQNGRASKQAESEKRLQDVRELLALA